MKTSGDDGIGIRPSNRVQLSTRRSITIQSSTSEKCGDVNIILGNPRMPRRVYFALLQNQASRVTERKEEGSKQPAQAELKWEKRSRRRDLQLEMQR